MPFSYTLVFLQAGKHRLFLNILLFGKLHQLPQAVNAKPLRETKSKGKLCTAAFFVPDSKAEQRSVREVHTKEKEK